MQPLSKESAEKTIVGPPKALQEFLGRSMEKPIDFWFRTGKAGGEPKPTETAQVACQWSVSGIDHRDLVAEREGKLSEWSKEPHSKCGVRITSYRGFESLTFRKRKARETELKQNKKMRVIWLSFLFVRQRGQGVYS